MILRRQVRAPAPLAVVVRREEQLLLSTLTGWAVLSTVGGAALWWRTRRNDRAAAVVVAGFGRQSLLWGVVDGVIAAHGWRGLVRARHAGTGLALEAGPDGAARDGATRDGATRDGAGPDGAAADGAARRRARRLAALTGANALLDVGYVAAGTALAVRSARRRGDGAAVASQGAFLLWLDLRHAARFLHHVARARG